MEWALKDAESRRATLAAEMEGLERKQAPAVLQLMPARLRQNLAGLSEKPRNGPQGRVREAIEQTVGGIMVAADGTLTIETKPDGLLGLEGRFAPLECRGNDSQ